MLSTKWALRIMRLLPKPLAREWRRRRMLAVRKRDGDEVVLRRILDGIGLELTPNGEMKEKPDA